jgi:hypothetical protein
MEKGPFITFVFVAMCVSAPKPHVFGTISLSSHPPTTIATPTSSSLQGSGCSRAGVPLDQGIVCDASETVRRVSIDGVNPRELDFRYLAVRSAAGIGAVRFQPKETYGWVFPLVRACLGGGGGTGGGGAGEVGVRVESPETSPTLTWRRPTTDNRALFWIACAPGMLRCR